MIRFIHNPTFKDYSALNRHVLWQRFRVPVILAGLLFTLYCLLPLLARTIDVEDKTANDFHLGPPLLVIPLIFLTLWCLLRFNIRKSWNKAGELRAERTYEIDETGVRVAGPSFSGFLEWQHIERAERTAGYYFLKTTQNQYYYFPESVVPDAQSLLDLLTTNLPKKEKR